MFVFTLGGICRYPAGRIVLILKYTCSWIMSIKTSCMKHFLFFFVLIILGQACNKSNSSGGDSKGELINDTLSVRYDFDSEFNQNCYTIKANSLDSLMPVGHNSFTDSSKKCNYLIGLRPYNVLFRNENGGCYSKTQFIPYYDERGDSNLDKRYIFLQYRY